MSDKEMKDFVEALYPFFLEKIKKDGFFKNCVKAKNATVISERSTVGSDVEIQLPYDKTSFIARNETGVELVKGDNVCIVYWIDLKNAVAFLKVRS